MSKIQKFLMASMHSLFLVSVVALLASIPANGCTVEIESLRKQFRRANAVFMGKIIELDNGALTSKELTRIPDDWRDTPQLISKVSFSIEKTWKGSSRKQAEYVGVPVFDCGCPGGKIDELVDGKEYLIFANEKNFITVCESAPADREHTRSQVKQLNSFWFRFFARIVPL
ncbi:MAG: hypothetical protein QM785_11285 [Pyrinomonadaceae bacterium]